MVFALQGFTKEFIAMDGDGIGVEYLGKTDNEARDIWWRNYAGKRQLLEYEIQDWKLFIDNTGEMSQAEVKIVFRRLACKIKKMNWTIIGIGWNKKYVPRNIEYHVYGVFLQQLILLIVGFLTFFFEVTNFSVSKKNHKKLLCK